MPFQIIRNDITKVKADAIVNTANPRPVIGSGTDSAIYKAAGEELMLAERKKIGDIEPGQVASTAAFGLDARFVIHTVGPAWVDGDHGERDILRSCYRNSLDLAAELSCASVAFPLIATGVYGFPKDEALQIALAEVNRFLLGHDMDVILVVFDSKAFELSGKLVGDIEEYIDEHAAASIRAEEYSSDYVGASIDDEDYYDRRAANRARYNGTYSDELRRREEQLRREERRRNDAGKYGRAENDRSWFKRKNRKEADARLLQSDTAGYAEKEAIQSSELSESEKEIADDSSYDDLSGTTGIIPDDLTGNVEMRSEVDEDYEGSPLAAAEASFPGAPEASFPDVAGKSLDEVLGNAGDTFQQRLFKLIDESGMDDVTVYKKANIDRKVFSRIRCKKDYKPKKKTAVAFAIALELDMEKMMDLLSRAEIAFSPSNKFDLIISYFITNQIYDIYEINAALFKYDQPILG